MQTSDVPLPAQKILGSETGSAFDNLDRLAPALRPRGSVAGYHRWWDLTFLHWRFPAEEVARLIPPELTLDTWEGDAWVGLVPFHMPGIRPWWFPPVPGVSAFAETNVRTYVHYRGGAPGVWFFSLDAARSLPVLLARWKWHLPYYRAEMSVVRRGSNLAYRSRRLWPGTAGSGSHIEIEAGDFIGINETNRSRPPGQALPGTLEHFLAERYFLYARTETGTLFRGQVHHTPYPLRKARVIHCEDSLLAAAGFNPHTPPEHAMFSDGVQVEVFPLTPIAQDSKLIPFAT